VIDSRTEFREQPRVAVEVAGDHQADARALRRLGHGGEHGPAFEDWRHRVGAGRRNQVVEFPAVVESRILRDVPHRPVDVERKVPDELQSDPERVHRGQYTGRPAQGGS